MNTTLHTKLRGGNAAFSSPARIHVVHPPLTQVTERLAEGLCSVAYGGDMLFLGSSMRQAVGELRAL